MKSGRDCDGQAWRESWKEIYQHDVNGTPFIHREASKWSHTPAGQCWSEGWTEDYRSDGSVDRYCEKTGSLEDGAAPEDGHANRWTEKWGEKWDGKGGCIKWTDTWASRDHAEGGQADAPSEAGREVGGEVGPGPTTTTDAWGRDRVSPGTRWAADTARRPGERNITRTVACTSTATARTGASTGTSGATAAAVGGSACRASVGTRLSDTRRISWACRCSRARVAERAEPRVEAAFLSSHRTAESRRRVE